MVSTWFILMVTTTLAPVLNRSCRYLRFSLYRSLLCPVGEVFDGARVQPASGIRHRVLWDHRDYRKQESTASQPCSPVSMPYPVEFRYLALCVNTGYFI